MAMYFVGTLCAFYVLVVDVFMLMLECYTRGAGNDRLWAGGTYADLGLVGGLANL